MPGEDSKARRAALRNPISACCFLGLTLLTEFSIRSTAKAAGNASWKKDIDGEWLSNGSWSIQAAYPGSLTDTTNVDTATFAATGIGSNISISFNNNTLTLGTISVTNGNRNIGSSGGAGTLLLNGTTIGSTANVILNVTGGSTLTLQPSIAGGTGPMSLALGNSTNNVALVETGSTIAINTSVAPSSGTKQLTVAGGGAVTLGGPANSFAPTALNLNAGTLVLGGAEKIANGTAINLNGGTINTGGFSETVGALTLSSNSTINLGAGASTLTFTNLAGYTSGQQLTITGWDGNFASGGTLDHIYFTTSVTNSAFLANVVFSGFNGGVGGSEIILQSNGLYELVPVPEPTTILGGMALAGLVAFRERRRIKLALQRIPGFRRLISVEA
jgi:hypothetical protein